MQTLVSTLPQSIARLKRLYPHRAEEINDILREAIAKPPMPKARTRMVKIDHPQSFSVGTSKAGGCRRELP